MARKVCGKSGDWILGNVKVSLTLMTRRTLGWTFLLLWVDIGRDGERESFRIICFLRQFFSCYIWPLSINSHG
jgi:hypothetical protein